MVHTSVITCVQLEHSDVIQQLRDDYLRTLVAPMGGMWESAVIPEGTFWEIQDQGHYAGYFCLDSEQHLLRFFLTEDYQVRAQEILAIRIIRLIGPSLLRSPMYG